MAVHSVLKTWDEWRNPRVVLNRPKTDRGLYVLLVCYLCVDMLLPCSNNMLLCVNYVNKCMLDMLPCII